MSLKTDLFEQIIVSSVNKSLAEKDYRLSFDLPNWLIDLGIRPEAIALPAKRTGSSGSKTDVIIHLEDSEPIKISAKLSNADYFGNWYSHNRILEEFGNDVFDSLTKACTKWANEWKDNPAASLFVGVSVCFGKRGGDTAQEFTEIFTYDDIVKIVAGVGNGDQTANCLYVSSNPPQNFEELINNLQPIDKSTILNISSNFKVAHRPINPGTEGTNRGKCIYTQFRPYKKLTSPTIIKSLSELNQLGEYITVEPNSLNHNRLLKSLEEDYNIVILKK